LISEASGVTGSIFRISARTLVPSRSSGYDIVGIDIVGANNEMYHTS
jgi:hypothetical protein